MSGYIFRAVLRKADSEGIGAIPIPFPIPDKEYADTVKLLAEAEVGDPILRDCYVEEIDSWWSSLKVLEGRIVNADELDYLAKRLDSFDDGEAAQFQGMASKLALTDIQDLINLTFCCQQATVIRDFSDLEQIGRDHYINIHGGCAPTAELEKLNKTEIALRLIRSGGTVTPYGVVYDNGMKLEPVYTGHEFPPYDYNKAELAVTINAKETPKKQVWLGLPMPPLQLERYLDRSGLREKENLCIEMDGGALSGIVTERMDLRWEFLAEVNDLCQSVARLSQEERTKLDAAICLAQPEGAYQLRRIAEELDAFDFIPNVRTPQELGEYMIRDSGHFGYDPNLEEYIRFERYGEEMMERENGRFTAQGYISYQGGVSLEELMMEEPAVAEQRERSQAVQEPRSPVMGQQMM